ncbi:hypothetical protein JW859_06895 [bacterium]|nr:hypothetical protein [bacterium]
MYEPRQLHSVLGAIGAALVLLILAGCPQPNPKSTPQAAAGGAGASSATTQSTANSAQAISLFAGTELEHHPPFALDMDRACSHFYTVEAGTNTSGSKVVRYELAEDGLGATRVVLDSTALYRAWVRAHPSQDECLLISHEQLAGEPVCDVLWRCVNNQLGCLDYRKVEGFPRQLSANACYNLEPAFSWDGRYVIVPLWERGFCILELATGTGRFIEYPDGTAGFTGLALDGRPPAEDRDLLYLSLWRIGGVDPEWCNVSVIDLPSGEYLRKLDLDWVVYDIAGNDIINEPWLVHGSRLPNKNTEHKRVLRLALIDPATEMQKLLNFYGLPYWPMGLEPHGQYAVFLDQLRGAIARLNPATEVVEFDPRYYNPETQVIVAEGGERVYCWYKAELVRARFTEQTDYAEDGDA